METYISILRGINVSGHKMIRMKDLTELLSLLNFKDLRTYIQSGNILFRSQKTDPQILSQHIQKKIFEKYKFEVPVITLTSVKLKKIEESNPFLKEDNIEIDKLHVTFLSADADAEDVEKIKELDFSPDRFVVLKREVYIYCPEGYGNTKLNNTFFEKRLKRTATTRNLKTVRELIKLSN